jgi:DNA-binding NarL/FixJ family response regulator
MKKPRALRAVIVDDHPMVRLSLRLALQTAPDVEVIGEAADGEEALRVCGELHPDVVLMDLRLPGQDSIETIRALGRQEPASRVLVYTAEYDAQLIPEAFAAGACGYVLKQGEIAELLDAMRAAQERQQSTR